MTLATYNVHGCVGTDGTRDPERVAEVIRGLNVDLVGLQEVDCREGPCASADQLERLAAATGLHEIPGPTLRTAGGYFGNAVLTRHPPIQVVQTDLSVRHREPRGMMDIRLRVAARDLRVVVTHFGLRAAERRHQVDVLLNLLAAERTDAIESTGCDAMVLLGDFNEWRPRARSLARVHRAFGRTPSRRTFPARWPLLALDRIWVRPRRAVRELFVARSALARTASDHLPLCATLDLERLGNGLD